MKAFAAIALLLAPLAAAAQGPPPFALDAPGSASQRVDIVPSAQQDDGTSEIELFPVAGGGEQTRDQTGAGSKHGRLMTIPASVGFTAFPSGGTPFSAVSLPEGYGTRSFLVFEDPVTTPGPTAPFLFAGEHVYEAQCPSLSCGLLEGPLKSEAESSFDLPGGAIAARAETDTRAHGRRYYDGSPFGGSIYNHLVEASAGAAIRDWVYVTGAGAVATLVVGASIGASIDTPFVPVAEEDWTTPVYGDVRSVDPCTDATTTSDEQLRPLGLHENEIGVALAIEAGFAQQAGASGPEWVPAVQDGASLDVARSADLHWADEEALPDCTDDFAEVTASANGSLAPSLVLSLEVPTNQWARVSATSSARASCLGPFACELDASAPVQISVTSADATLVAWHGIAGLVRVPEPGAAGSIATAIAAIGARARRRGRRSSKGELR